MKTLPLALYGLATVLSACDSAPPSWDKLISAKIVEQYPAANVINPAPGKLQIETAGQASREVETDPIAQFCRRGPRDCDYAIDQLLLELRQSPPLKDSAAGATITAPATNTPNSRGNP